MTVAVPAIVKVPVIYTDADFPFDFEFFAFDLNTPYSFESDDVFSLTLVCRDPTIEKTAYLSSDVGSPVNLSLPNIVSVRIPMELTQLIVPTGYAYELRRLGSDGSTDVLAIGIWQVQFGLSLDATLNAPANWDRMGGISTGANIIFTNASAQIIYTGISPPGTPKSRTVATNDSDRTVKRTDIGGTIYLDATNGDLVCPFSPALGSASVHSQVTFVKTDGTNHKAYVSDGTSNFVVMSEADDSFIISADGTKLRSIIRPPNV